MRKRKRRSREPAQTPPKPSTPEQLFGAIVKVSVQAVPDARSAATLGSEREGTGVVIGDDGLILTIGYLIVEADDVSVDRQPRPTLRRAVVAYDHATGLGPGAHDRAARTPSRCRSAIPASSPIAIR